MSAAEPAAEPSMEEILASIRKAISEDHALSQEDGPDPFGADSTAASAFSTPPAGKSFDTAENAKHDPFAQLNAKLDERRDRKEAVQPSAPTTPPQQEPAAQSQPQPSRTIVQTAQPKSPVTQQAKPETQPSRPAQQQPLSAKTKSDPPPEQARAPEPRTAPKTEGAFKPFSEAFAAGAKKQTARPETRRPEQIEQRQKETETGRAKTTASSPSIPVASTFQAEFRAQTKPQEPEKPQSTWRERVHGREAGFPLREETKSELPAASAPRERPASSTNVLSERTQSIVSQTIERAKNRLGLKTAGSLTIEQLVVTMLEPLLKEWLDENLPELVEEILRDEIKQVSRQRG